MIYEIKQTDKRIYSLIVKKQQQLKCLAVT